MAARDDTRLIERHAIYIAAFGVVLCVVAFAWGGKTLGIATLVGAVLSLANWLALRYIGLKLVRAQAGAAGSTKNTGRGAIILLVLKMSALLGVCAALLLTRAVDPLGFVLGIGALVLGVIAGGLHSAVSSSLAPSEES